MDPDLPIFRQQWIEHNALAVAHALEIENWVRMGANSFISFTEWKTLSPFEREALKRVKNEVSKEIEKEVRQKEADLNQKLENAKEYKSPFAGTPPTPSFIK
jgi:TRAP-type C4-dicarboxylate transport system substrate-binding protein